MAETQSGKHFSVIAMNKLEDLRRSFRPDRITTLFVGESAPRSGKFFYSQNSGLYRAVKLAFHCEGDFLTAFRAKGFYLDDLSLVPVNGMAPTERRRQCEASIDSLTGRLKDYMPQAIVILVRSIDTWVREAAKQAELNIPIYTTTYPGRFQNHRERFQNEMAVIIPQLLELRQGSNS
jgi:hypothetical protein